MTGVKNANHWIPICVLGVDRSLRGLNSLVLIPSKIVDMHY